jgi:site-specific DNA recombinase
MFSDRSTTPTSSATPPHPPIRAAVYLRVSTHKQELEGYGLDYQERECRAYCERNGYEIVEKHVYREAFTGTLLEERPHLTAIRDAVPSGAFDIVLSYDIDRVQREDWFYGFLRDEWKPYNVRFAFVTEPRFNNDDEAEDFRALTGLMARYKRVDQLRKTRNGRIERGRQGYIVTGNRELFGYAFADVEEGNRTRRRAAYTIIESEAATVRLIFEKLYNYQSINSIAKELNQRGIPTKRGGKWYARTLHNIITHPAYKGQRTNFTSRTNRTMKGIEPVLNPETICPRIIEPEIWDAVQSRLEENKALNKGSMSDPTKAWFKGYVACGYCGKHMRAHQTGRRNGANARAYKYECNANRYGLDRCSQPMISAAKLDREVLQEIRTYFESPVWYNSQTQHIDTALAKTRREFDANEERLTKLRAKEVTQWELVEDLPRELRADAMQRLATTKNEIAHWTAQQTTLTAALAQLTTQRAIVQSLGDTEGRINYWPSAVGAKSFDAMGYQEWQTIFRLWKPLVEVFEDGHSPRWRVDFECILFDAVDDSLVTESDMEELLDESWQEVLANRPWESDSTQKASGNSVCTSTHP